MVGSGVMRISGRGAVRGVVDLLIGTHQSFLRELLRVSQRELHRVEQKMGQGMKC